MRRLRLVIGRAGAVPVLVSAALVGAEACGSEVEVVHPRPTSSGVGGDTSVTVTATSTSSGFGGFGPGAGGTGAGGDCPFSTEFIVPDPGTGMPVDVAALCAAAGGGPVTQHDAARVTLSKFSQALELAMGFVAVDPGLESLVVGLPTFEVFSELPPLAAMQISNITPTAGGFTFDAQWPPLDGIEPSFSAWMHLRVELQIDCAGELQTVSADTYINLCDGDGDVVWVSSGDDCKVCDIVAEMAPSPIVSDKQEDELPLARALRLRLVPIATFADSVLLYAEHDGGGEAEVSWDVAEGELEHLGPDLVVWRKPGEHIQVAVVAGEGAAIASLSARGGRLLPGVAA